MAKLGFSAALPPPIGSFHLCLIFVLTLLLACLVTLKSQPLVLVMSLSLPLCPSGVFLSPGRLKPLLESSIKMLLLVL